MIRFKLERRPESTRAGWSEVREELVGPFFLPLSLGFLFLSVLLLSSDGIIITSFSKPFAVVTVVVAVGLVVLGVDRWVSHCRTR